VCERATLLHNTIAVEHVGGVGCTGVIEMFCEFSHVELGYWAVCCRQDILHVDGRGADLMPLSRVVSRRLLLSVLSSECHPLPTVDYFVSV
jgi:hypothetical protein